jgi:LPPG:FO 2-phospho-L-lactate transferase
MTGPIVTLSGGVGGAKMVLGLSHLVENDRLVVACNTGDDFDHLGLRICPDIDSVLYALAGLSDEERGWGRRAETWTCMSALRELGGPGWFNLGDADLATHLLRSDLLRHGRTPGEVTADLARHMGVKAKILPMSDDPVATVVNTQTGDLAFQHYFVREQCAPEVTGFLFEGIDQARVHAAIRGALENDPEAIVIAPSNPYVSIDPILGLRGMAKLLTGSGAPIVAVSPIVGGQALKGPAAKMMQELGNDVSALGIAKHYQGLVDGIVIDEQDAHLAHDIESLGIRTRVARTVMTDLETRVALAEATLDFAREIAQ